MHHIHAPRPQIHMRHEQYQSNDETEPNRILEEVEYALRLLIKLFEASPSTEIHVGEFWLTVAETREGIDSRDFLTPLHGYLGGRNIDKANKHLKSFLGGEGSLLNNTIFFLFSVNPKTKAPPIPAQVNAAAFSTDENTLMRFELSQDDLDRLARVFPDFRFKVFTPDRTDINPDAAPLGCKINFPKGLEEFNTNGAPGFTAMAIYNPKTSKLEVHFFNFRCPDGTQIDYPYSPTTEEVAKLFREAGIVMEHLVFETNLPRTVTDDDPSAATASILNAFANLIVALRDYQEPSWDAEAYLEYMGYDPNILHRTPSPPITGGPSVVSGGGIPVSPYNHNTRPTTPIPK